MHTLEVKIRTGEGQPRKTETILREKVAIVDAANQPAKKITGTLLELQNLN